MVVATNHDEFAARGARAGARRGRCWSTPGTRSARARLRPVEEVVASDADGRAEPGFSSPAAPGRSAPPSSGGCWRTRLRGARLGPARGAGVDARGMRGPDGDLRDSDAARDRARGCERAVHLAAIVGGIANFHKLPHTLLEVNNALYNALFRAAVEQQPERLVYVSSPWCSSARGVPDHRGVPRPSAPRRARPTGSRSWPASTTAGRRATSTACGAPSCGPSTPTGRARCRGTSRGSRTSSRT